MIINLTKKDVPDKIHFFNNIGENLTFHFVEFYKGFKLYRWSRRLSYCFIELKDKIVPDCFFNFKDSEGNTYQRTIYKSEEDAKRTISRYGG